MELTKGLQEDTPSDKPAQFKEFRGSACTIRNLGQTRGGSEIEAGQELLKICAVDEEVRTGRGEVFNFVERLE